MRGDWTDRTPAEQDRRDAARFGRRDIVVANGALLMVGGRRYRTGERLNLPANQAERFVARGSARYP